MKILSSAPQPDALLTVATLNTWHGLSGKGKVNFGSLETRSERVDRLERQVQALQALNADIVLLQEVNPLPFRAFWYASKLGKRCYFHAVNSGIKLGWGLPTNLNEGLTILCPPTWEWEYVGSKRLSGSFRVFPFRVSAVANPFFSFQLHESRSAMAVRVHLPKSRQTGQFRGATSVIVAVTHLHHAPSLSRRARKLLDDALKEGLDSKDENFLLEQFQAAETRRTMELDILSDWLEEVRKPGEAVLLAGDFNSEPDSAAMGVLRRRGWVDSWVEAKNTDDAVQSATWDPSRNPLAFRGQQFHSPAKERSAQIEKFLTETDALPRRIDYVFFRPWNAKFESQQNEDVGCFGRLLDVRRFGYLNSGGIADEDVLVTDNFSDLDAKEPFAFAPGSDNHFISDHFGLVATFGA